MSSAMVSPVGPAPRRRRQARQAAEQPYRRLFEHLPIGLFRSTLDGAILEANPAFANLLGWGDPAAALGQSLTSRYADPRDRERLLSTLRTEAEVRNHVVRFTRVDGRQVWAELTVRLERASHGHAVLEGMARDVTEELAAQQQLSLLASALEAAADAIVITDPQGAVEWANPSFYATTGFSADAVRGWRLGDLARPDRRDRFDREIGPVLDAGRCWVGETESRRQDGRSYVEQMSLTPVRDRAGAVAHFVAVKRDVSEQRALEAQFRQANKMEAVGQLAGGIAHDFNNLMTAILGYCEILLEQMPVEDPNRADIVEIRSAGVRASSLTRQLLAFSRKQILKPTTFDVRSTVAGMDKMLRRVIREDITVVVAQSEDPLYIRADVGQMEQVLLNLVINASDAMQGGGTLTVGTRRAVLDDAFVRSHPGAACGRYVALDVRDTGVGMPPEVLTRVFEPFFTTKPQGKGTGLGLSMVYGIVKQSGGYIAASSTSGAGSTFTVYLPEETAPVRIESAMLRPANRVDSPCGAIVVAEDDATIRELVCRVLSRGGYDVVAGGSAREAMASLESYGRTPDLLLTDIVMPDTNGIEFARILRERHPRLPVIFMSGYHDALDDPAGDDEGPAGRLLQKPVSPDALLRAVHESLGQSRAEHGWAARATS